MPLYTYECAAGHATTELRAVDQRHNPVACETCGGDAILVITPVAFDNLGMGTSSAFPTAYSKWERLQRAKRSAEEKRSQ